MASGDRWFVDMMWGKIPGGGEQVRKTGPPSVQGEIGQHRIIWCHCRGSVSTRAGALGVPFGSLDSLLQAKEKSSGVCQAQNQALRKKTLAGAERRDCG